MVTLKRLQLALISTIVLSGVIANVYYLMK